MNLTRLDHIQFKTNDLNAATAYYRDVLGFKITWSGIWAGSGKGWVHLRSGTCYLSIFQVAAGDEPSGQASYCHMGWVVNDLEAFKRHLFQCGHPVTADDMNRTQEGNHLYLTDPDGNEIELTEYRSQP